MFWRVLVAAPATKPRDMRLVSGVLFTVLSRALSGKEEQQRPRGRDTSDRVAAEKWTVSATDSVGTVFPARKADRSDGSFQGMGFLCVLSTSASGVPHRTVG